MEPVTHPGAAEPETTLTVEQEGDVLLSTFSCRSELGVRAVDHPVHAAVVVMVVVTVVAVVVIVVGQKV
jgi:hypothetical protein